MCAEMQALVEKSALKLAKKKEKWVEVAVREGSIGIVVCENNKTNYKDSK